MSIESTKKLPTKFYIDRKDSKSNHRHLRKIINEDEVKFFLKKNGFTILSLSQFNFADQINLFKNAENIIGLHGAGFANLTFCKPKTSVLELKPISAGEVIGNLAKKNNLLYQDISIVPSENSNNNQQGFIKIPMNLLEKNKLMYNLFYGEVAQLVRATGLISLGSAVRIRPSLPEYMKNISIFCLTLNPKHEKLIRNLNYLPVGLGDKKFSENCFSDKKGLSISKKKLFLWRVHISLLDLEKLY